MTTHRVFIFQFFFYYWVQWASIDFNVNFFDSGRRGAESGRGQPDHPMGDGSMWQRPAVARQSDSKYTRKVKINVCKLLKFCKRAALIFNLLIQRGRENKLKLKYFKCMEKQSLHSSLFFCIFLASITAAEWKTEGRTVYSVYWNYFSSNHSVSLRPVTWDGGLKSPL